MKTIQNYFYNISNNLNMEIEILENSYNIDIDELFGLAARINKKRSFLFVSKVLGKHIPAKPEKVMYIGRLLGELYVDKRYGIKRNSLDEIQSLNIKKEKLLKEKINLPEKNIIIGFAETATALGHTVFETFKNAKYIHTTREKIKEKPIFDFKEEHSHATSHTIFSFDKNFFNNKNPIILVDDEITTGKTAINIINKIHEKYPRKNYVILTILDWRSKAHREKYCEIEKKLGIKIDVYSLISGNVKVEGKVDFSQDIYNSNEINRNHVRISEYYFDDLFNPLYEDYIKYTGRFGIESEIHQEIDNVSNEIAKRISDKDIGKNKKKLFLGVGEFMYFPLKIANYSEGDIYYHSTTRSPILPENKKGYAIQNKFKMHNIYDNSIEEYLYNVPKKFYDSLYIFYERYSNKKEIEILKNKLLKLGIKNINICFMTSFEKGEKIDQ